jgi:hypothetical protein
MRQELIWRGVQVIEKMERETGFEPATSSLEVTRHFNFRHLESAGVGLESTETPGETAVHRERLLRAPLNGVQLECSPCETRTSRNSLAVVPNPGNIPLETRRFRDPAGVLIVPQIL